MQTVTCSQQSLTAETVKVFWGTHAYCVSAINPTLASAATKADEIFLTDVRFVFDKDLYESSKSSHHRVNYTWIEGTLAWDQAANHDLAFPTIQGRTSSVYFKHNSPTPFIDKKGDEYTSLPALHLITIGGAGMGIDGKPKRSPAMTAVLEPDAVLAKLTDLAQKRRAG